MDRPPFRRGEVVTNGRTGRIVNRVYKVGDEWRMLVADYLWSDADDIATRTIEVSCDGYHATEEKREPIKIKLPKMSKTATVVGSILAVVVFIGAWFAGNYNSLVTAKNQVDQAWGNVEIQYQRRLDLVDNLVQSVKGAQKQEQEVFIKIAEARQRVINAGSVDEKVQATNDLETNIALLPRLQEAYPELKSSELMNSLMKELAGTENGIADTRVAFNNTATNYNTNITRFPKNLFASTFGFEKVALFKSESGAEKGAKVQF